MVMRLPPAVRFLCWRRKSPSPPPTHLLSRLLSQLDHPNVIELYEAFVDVAPHAGAQLFIITELMPHGDLASLLE